MVPVDSSAARIPLPGVAIWAALAMSSSENDSISSDYSFHEIFVLAFFDKQSSMHATGNKQKEASNGR